MTGFKRKYEALVAALPEREQRLLACRIARWALTEFKVEDPRPWEAVEVSERYADGLATLEELSAARAAAGAAAADAADAAGVARDSAGDNADAVGATWAAQAAALTAAWAAEDASRAAARYAARAAVRDVAWAAADAAWDDAYKMFFEWALELMIGEKVAA